MAAEKINVCYALSDTDGGYTKIAGTSICSLLDNTSGNVIVHILHDGTLNKRNVDYLYGLVEEKYKQKLVLHDVSTSYSDLWERINGIIPKLANSRLSIATFFRLIMGEVLSSEKRIIYLDADTIVNMDVRELWHEKTGPNGIGAAADPFIQKYHHNITRNAIVPQKEYFNAGVLLVDLDKFRLVEDLTDKALSFLMRHDPDYLDQDILNYYFPRSCVLDGKYNAVVWMEQESHKSVGKCIYHYVNNCLGFEMRDEYNALFYRYFSKTPWCDEIFIGNMSRMIEYVRFEILDLGNKCANKRRIVVGLDSARDSICNMLMLREDELFIPFEKMEEYIFDFNKNKDVLLIALNQPEYESMRENLKSLELTEDIHFFNLLQKLGIEKSNTKEYNLFLKC